jgi:anaerobic carbon-monoxide dehydrogenase catalytic subunit
MAMRTMLLHNIMGAGTYSHHAYEAFRTLRETAQKKACFKISDTEKLKGLMKSLRHSAPQILRGRLFQ